MCAGIRSLVFCMCTPVNGGFAGVRKTFCFFSSDGRSLAGGGAESYRYPPAGGSSPELRVLTQRLSDNPTESDNQSSLSSLSSQKEGWSQMRPALSSIIRHALSQMRSDSQKSPAKLILRHGQKTTVLVISS